MAVIFDPVLGKLRTKDVGLGTLSNPFPETGFYMYDTSGGEWLVTLNPAGYFNFSFITPPSVGTLDFIYMGFLPIST
jgi:hypothetical protein